MKSPEEIQREALERGRKMEAEGRRVIYIHGRAYADPAEDPPDHTESPFPWNLWDGERPE